MLRSLKRGLLAGCAVCAGLVIYQPEAEAAGFYVREHSTSAMITGFAGSASQGTDASHLFYNPATIVKNDGMLDVTGDFRTFFPDIELSGTAATNVLGAVTGAASTGNMADAASFAPSFFASYALTDRLRVGIGGSGPFAAVIASDRPWIGRFNVTKTNFLTININPVAAYQLTDWLSIGAGIQFQHFDANMQNGQIAPGPFETTGYLIGKDWGFGLTAGLLIEPRPGTTIGVGYRSQIEHKFKGKAGLAVSAPMRANFEITTPDIVTASISHQVSDALTLHGTFEWANWSLFDNIVVTFPGSATPTETRPQLWKDTYSGFGGASYQYDEKTTIGAGVGYTTAVSDGTSSSISPDADRITVGVGITHEIMKGLTAKASYSHVFFDDANLNITAAPNTLTGKGELDLHILGFSLTMNM